MTNDEYESIHLQIYKAVARDDWNIVTKTFEEQPELRIKPINDRSETPLMIAVGENRSHHFVKRLVSDLSTDGLIDQALAAENDEGDTALHYAATVKNMVDLSLLVSSSSQPLDIIFRKNKRGITPLFVAAYQGKRNEMLEFLFRKIDVLDPPISGIPDESLRRGDLLAPAIEGEYIDIALKLVTKHSNIILSTGFSIQRALNKLAANQKFFHSGSTLGFWGRLIYSLLPVHESKIIADHEKTTSQQYVQDEESIYTTAKEFSYRKSTSKVWFKRILRYIGSPMMDIYDMKVTHRQAIRLVQCLCEGVIKRRNKGFTSNVFRTVMFSAVHSETVEVIEEIIRAFPSIAATVLPGNEYNFLHEAIKVREERIYNLLYQITSYRMWIANHINEETNENVLHVVARMVPPRLGTTGGAALQMHHELEWFKEVESNLVQPFYKEDVNKHGKTPRMVFSEEHENLLKEGQNWMQGTASSSTVVAALIVTMAFAAAFTVPGGNKSDGKNEGKPVYLDNGAFMLFIISDAVALFSSVTSVLMFLGILTSRYAEEDFLYSLPKKMTIGLVSLFMSLAAMIVAFSATLAVVLRDKVNWIAAPLIIITCIPVSVWRVTVSFAQKAHLLHVWTEHFS